MVLALLLAPAIARAQDAGTNEANGAGGAGGANAAGGAGGQVPPGVKPTIPRTNINLPLGGRRDDRSFGAKRLKAAAAGGAGDPKAGAAPGAVAAAGGAATTAPAQENEIRITAPGNEEVPSIGDVKPGKTQRCKKYPADQKISLDFKGDILELVAAISKLTCKNFIITSKIRSQKFDIVSPTPITVEEAWRAFLSALEANEFTIFQVGRYYKIIQSNDGTRAPVPIYDEGEKVPFNDRMVTKIWKVKYASDLNTVVNYLNIFKSSKGQIHPFTATNTVIGTDFGTSMERIERVLKEIDQPGALEQVHVVPVEFAAATEIAEKLNQVFEPNKAGPNGARNPNSIRMRVPGSPETSAVPPPQPGQPIQPGQPGQGEDDEVAVSKILADERTNKLVIIASDRAFGQIMALKKELDIPAEGSDSQIQVVHLRHADAEELATTLSALAQGRPTAAKKGAPTHPGAQPIPGQPNIPGQPSGALFQGDVKVTANKPTNSLLITASKSDFGSLRRVIDRLDMPRYQVFVEAVIMEVSAVKDRTLGLTWHGGISPMIGGKQTPILFGNEPTSSFSSLAFGTNPLSLAALTGFATAVRGPTLAGTETLIQGGIPSIGVVIQALQTSNNVNVVSSPHLLTLDNEEAEIQVSEKRPFSSGINLGGLGALSGLAGAAGAAGALPGGLNLGGLGLGSIGITREDVGLTLKLKPQIHDEDFVRLQIDQELSDVVGQDLNTNQPITSKRKVKSVVVVRSQDTVVIGGLVKDRQSIDESKMPLFGDLPLIGWLFKRQVKSNQKVNLLLILTPYIIRNQDDFRVIFERKMAERKEFADRYYGLIEDYKPQIDWTRKRGPLASYRLSIRKELSKAENEGPGSEDETVIRPDGTTDKILKKRKRREALENDDGDEQAPGSAPAPSTREPSTPVPNAPIPPARSTRPGAGAPAAPPAEPTPNIPPPPPDAPPETTNP